MQTVKLRRCVLLGASATVGLWCEANAQTPAGMSEPGNDGEAVEEVVVTGSRVATSGFTTPTPTTVIGEARLQAFAPSSIGDALLRMPALRDVGSREQAGRFTGGARAQADLRGLGAVRTLVLVDGRRWVQSHPDGTIDTNLIPADLVERVDVVTGGASSAYGSDAVAGVVNFVLKDRMNGISGKSQYGISDRGDAEEYVFSLAAGTSVLDDRLHLIAGGDYSSSDQSGTIYSRDWAADEEWLVPFPTNRPAGVPARVFARNVTYGRMTPGSLVLSGPLAGTAFGPGGTPYQFQAGQVVGNVMVGGSNPGINPAGNYFLVQPVERYAMLTRATFEVNDDVQVFAEASYGYHETDGFITWQQSPSFVVSVDNPFMPAETRAQMISEGLTSLTLGRINTDMGGGRYHVDEYDTHRYVIGARGRVGDFVDWDTYYQHGRATAAVRVPTDPLPANMLAAFYAVTGPDGQPACAPLETNPNLSPAQRALVTPGCVPYNVFGESSRSAAALDYVLDTSYNRSVIKQDVVALNLRAKPFSTWAGPVSAAIGGEARRESVELVSDPLSQRSLHALINAKPYTGETDVKEVYAEFLIPLAADAPWVESAALNLAGRVTDYSTSGTVTTWKAGFSYDTPIGARLRGTRSRDIRAPSLADLFSAGTFGGILNGAQNPFNGATGSLNGQTGGNPNLRPEVADAITFGIVYQPDWAPRLGLSADYYNIEIADVITTPTATEVLSRCSGGHRLYCDLLVTDNSPFGIAHVRLSPSNLAELKVSGVDLEASYRMSASFLPGEFTVRALASYLQHLQTTDAGVTIERAGSLVQGLPEWTFNLDLTYSLDRFATNLNVRGFNKMKWDSTALGPEDDGYDPASPISVNKNRFPGLTYVNWSLSYDLRSDGDRRVQIFGVVNNLIDRDPPSFALVANPTGGVPYGVVGRYYRAGFRFSY